MKQATFRAKKFPIGLYRSAENWASWLSVWMVYWANNKPENKGQKPKVGGHQASALSSSSILTAYYLHIRRPQDRMAVKPHAAPFLYSLLYMMGQLSRHDMENLREFGGLPAYPVAHHHPGVVDYSTSIEGIGCAATVEDAYEATVQNHQFGKRIDARYSALAGDGELTELQIGGALYEAGRRKLSNLCWWIDINRQSLDRVMEDSPLGSTGKWIENLFRANGWHTIDLRWGSKVRATPGLRERLEALSDSEYQALLLRDDAEVRRALGVEKNLIEDLGGHDLQMLIDAHEEALRVSDKPTAILCHTIKGHHMPGWAGHPENHGAVLSEEKIQVYRKVIAFDSKDPFALPAPDSEIGRLLTKRSRELFTPESRSAVAYPAGLVPKWEEIRTPLDGRKSTAAVFGNLNVTYLRTAIGKYMAFIAPDVGLTTHLGGVILATGVFDADPPSDAFRFLREKRLQPFGWRLDPQGQFHSIAINEGLAALLAFAFGREKYAIEGKERLIPVVTIYDVFWKHAYTQLYYALYDRARFIAVGTPSGTSLSRESGTHQSVQTPAIFMGLPNIIYYEPAFAYDMKVIYQWALEQIVAPSGESVYLRLTTQELDQPSIDDTSSMREQVIRGAYWLIHHRRENGYEPRRNVAHAFATGPVLREAIRASEILRDRGIFLNVCNVTSWERLKRDWGNYWAHQELWDDPAASYHLNELIPDDELSVPAVVAGDFTPQVAEWLGNALGKTIPVLGPRQFSETGDLASIRRLHGIDADSIVRTILQARALRS